MFEYVAAVAWLALLAMVLVGALWRGGWAERLVAVAILIGWIGSLVATHPRLGWAHPQWGVLAFDAALLAVILVVVLRTSLTWALVAAAFQFAAVALHLAFAIDPRWPPAYATALQGATWGMLIAVAVGVWNAWRVSPSGGRR